MRILAIATLAFVLGCVSGAGQAVSTSQITGTVHDSTGLAVPGAEVKVTQIGTGAVRTVTTRPDGGYVLPSLPIGPYQLEVSKEGFSKYLQSGIVLQVSTNPSIDVTLKVGSVTESVTVEANAAMVETHSTGIGTVVDQQRVVDLPLNGRTVTQLIYLAGAAIPGRAARSTYPNQEAPSIAGGGTGSVAYILDGGMHNDTFNNENLPLPFPDALQEFKVETSALPAQYGYHATGAVNAVTKSGTNEMHGDLFEFVRNFQFNARNTFATARDSLKRNQFGGTIGGPIIKNKLFYFLGYQGTIQRSNPPTTISFVPTAAMLSGNFTDVTSPACNNGKQITLPASLGFVNNQIDPKLFSAPAVKLASFLTPLTSNPCGKVQFGAPANQTENQVVAKVDYQRSNQHALFARYFITHLEVPPGDPSQSFLLSSVSGVSNQIQSLVLGDTYLIGANMVSSFRMTGTRNLSTNILNDFMNLSDLGVNIYSLPTPPRFMGLSVTNAFSLSGSTQRQPYNTIQLAEDVSLVRGAHQIGFGVNFINTRAFASSGGTQNGIATFNGQATGLGNADLLMGKVATLQQGIVEISNQRQTFVALYLQDAWRINSRLTVNAGIRWEPMLAAYSPYDQVDYFSLPAFLQGVRSKVYVNAPAGLLFDGDPGGPTNKHYMNSRMGEFAPRLGIVWDPKGNGRMTVRAAYGIFYDLPSFAFLQLGFTPPFGQSVILSGVDFANPWANYPGGNPFPVALTNNSQFPLYGQYFPLRSEVVPSYTQQRNVSIQKQVGSNWLVSASYLGNQSTHLWTDQAMNPGIFLAGASCVINGVSYSPCSSPANTNQRRALSLLNGTQGQYYGPVSNLDTGGTASYNGLLIAVQHRLSGNFTMATNYTWSHCISDPYTSAIGVPGAQYTHPDDRRADRGNCASADRRHVLTLSFVGLSPKFSNRSMQLVAGNWKFSTIIRAQSGGFFSVTTGVDTALNGINNQRANLVNGSPYPSVQSSAQWLSSTAFQAPLTGAYGNLGVNNLLGPGSLTADVALSRVLQIRERQNVEFRAEAFNVPNHVRLNNPTAALNSPLFGTITSAGDPRIMQFALKYIF